MKRLFLVVALLLVAAAPAQAAQGYYPIRGSGSSWSENAIKQWISDASTFGLTASYSGTGSSAGRLDFAQKMNDFAVSEIPFQGVDPTTGNADDANGRPFAYMPIVAGGTAFMYHVTINGKLVRDLRLRGDTITRIFTGAITNWNDDQITEDNNGRRLPSKKIVPVVRSDGSGTTAQFTLWMSKQHGDRYCPFFAENVNASKPCGLTSYYPTFGNAVAQSGSSQMAGYISAEYGEGAIGYVEYSYARALDYPVAKVRNAADYFVEPTDYNVAVALQSARIERDSSKETYLTQILDDVYRSPDARTYPLSSYSYMILPTSEDGKTTRDSGRTLSAFARYFLCGGQKKMGALGYSPLPLNLVQAGFEQVKRVPGAEQTDLRPEGCDNPTFDPADPNSNKLAKTAPMPEPCDKVGAGPCGTSGPQGNGQSSSNGQAGTEGQASANGQTPARDLDGDGQPDAGVDPVTGLAVGQQGQDGTSSATGNAVELAASRSDAGDRALTVLAAVELVLVLVVPTFVARAVMRRRSQGG
ncbi:phosphate ABC transporter substrate-binding protein PstS [Saccharothrix violaceirubra]|uniref:Phosphate ABC transporter phosphate-binding protein n=1 Tax=Saccharothrix violaceirubra TaxID=413306 RepID=A0A7W7WX44_9PSEU|nr:phosphate ABC transporter substrate-binding protein PstS [Saccharothrix violaceirubra]MBB4967054.1 phosphate ABC transporter phosphate-binding protein [Saccharothrix violaceirubra]